MRGLSGRARVAANLASEPRSSEVNASKPPGPGLPRTPIWWRYSASAYLTKVDSRSVNGANPPFIGVGLAGARRLLALLGSVMAVPPRTGWRAFGTFRGRPDFWR